MKTCRIDIIHSLLIQFFFHLFNRKNDLIVLSIQIVPGLSLSPKNISASTYVNTICTQKKLFINRYIYSFRYKHIYLPNLIIQNKTQEM